MTGPGRREDPDAQRRAEEARRQQTDAARSQVPPGFEGLFGPNGKPIKVNIEGGSEKFFEGFNRRVGADGQRLNPGHGFQGGGLDDQRAMAQSVKQVTDELRRAVDMAQQFQVQTRAALTAAQESQQRANDEQRTHLRQVLDSIERTLTRQEQRQQHDEHGSRVPDEAQRRPARPTRPLRDQETPQDLPGGAAPPGGPPRRPPTGQGYGPDEGPEDPGGGGDLGPVHGPELPPGMARRRADEAGDTAGAQSARDRQQSRADRERSNLRSRPSPFRSRQRVHPMEDEHEDLGPGRQRHRSRQSLRSSIRRSAAEALHQRYGQGTGGAGTLLPQYDEQGNLSHHVFRQDGQEDQIIEHGDSRLPGMLRASARQGVVSDMAGGLAEGGILGAAKAIPYVGTALAVADMGNQVLKTVGTQNRLSSEYQSIYAGDSKYGGDALGQRIQEEGYAWGNRFNAFGGGLTDADARTAFKGISALGQKGSERDNSLKFVEQNYANLGIDVQTSMDLVSKSVAGANTNLAGLSHSLQQVGQMARSTGQNANQLYQVFAKNYQQGLSMSLGAEAATFAASTTAITGGATRDLQGLSYAPLASETSQRVIASIAGKPYSWLEAEYQMGNTDPYTKAVDKKNDTAYRGALAGQGQVGQVIQQQIAAKGGTAAVAQDKGSWRDIALAAMHAPGADPANMRRYLQAQGVQDVSTLTDEQVYEAAVQHQVGAGSLTASTQANKEQFDQKGLQGSDNAFTKRGQGFMWLTQVQGSDWARSQVSTDPGVVAFGWGERGQKNEALKAYTERQQGQTSGGAGAGKTDPVIQDLITQVGNKSEVGIEVQTGKGKKVVSLPDAIRYYPDQLTKGSATVIGGDASTDGQSVKSLVGGSESNTTDSSTTGSTDDHGGVDAAQWKKDHPTDSSTAANTSGNGKITLDMSDQLKQWFSANVSGNVSDPSTEAGAGASVPPVPAGGLPH